MLAEFPDKLAFLFEPARYKVLYGGRGGAKSWGIARALLLLGAQKQMRILCAREWQNSIADSVHKLLVDQIADLGLNDFYTATLTSVRGLNGTEFAFSGLRLNPTRLKSYEGVDVCWVEEAQSVSAASWDILIPTIRKEGSEIWASLNPELEEDATYQRFIARPPDGAKVVKVGWQDNPWFPRVLHDEMMDLKRRDADAWLNVWEGHCKAVLDGAVYAHEMRRAAEDGRICRVPYDATCPVHTFWDLGFADNTAIWLAQQVGLEYRLIDYVQGNQQPLQHYLEQLQAKHYVYGTDWLPHDARARQLGTGRSIEEMMRAAGRTVRIVPQLSVADGINAARSIFGQVWINQERCADGLQCLRHYRYEPGKREPLHDHNSHGADAFRYLAVGLGADRPKPARVFAPPVFVGANQASAGWMR